LYLQKKTLSSAQNPENKGVGIFLASWIYGPTSTSRQNIENMEVAMFARLSFRFGTTAWNLDRGQSFAPSPWLLGCQRF
jgi:hypothetical protein